jgi:hypothetical protein
MKNTKPNTLELASFPVPTFQNPSAIFVDESLLLQKQEQLPTQTSLSSSSSKHDTRRIRFNEIRTSLAKGRNANRLAVTKEYEYKINPENFHKKWKLDAKAREDMERNKEAEALGIPKEKLYMLDTAAYVSKLQTNNTTLNKNDEISDAARRFIKTEQTIKETGKEALEKHFAIAEHKAAKRRAKQQEKSADNVLVGLDASSSIAINTQNIKLNKQLDKTLAHDPRAQTIKQNLERGTAL